MSLKKPLKIAVQMDPIDSIDIKGDSTFAILLEAQLIDAARDIAEELGVPRKRVYELGLKHMDKK